MANRQKDLRPPRVDAETPNVANLTAVKKHGESEADALARLSLEPAVQAGITIKFFTDEALALSSLDTLVKELTEQAERSNRGDLSRPEALLTAQAHSLDAIYNKLARKAARQGNLEVCETLMRLALKARSQSRSTIEALAEIKNPSHVTFAKQANIAHGPQQVNNSVVAREENTEIPPNKLLEHTNGERLESAAKGAAIGPDTTLAAVGAIHRTSDRRRKVCRV